MKGSWTGAVRRNVVDKQGAVTAPKQNGPNKYLPATQVKSRISNLAGYTHRFTLSSRMRF